MKIRVRKAFGTVATVVFITFYALLVMALGSRIVVGRGILAELPFYVIGGLGWLPFVMAIIRWMSKPD
jgi:Protein of unknown function (DUF2842)